MIGGLEIPRGYFYIMEEGESRFWNDYRSPGFLQESTVWRSGIGSYAFAVMEAGQNGFDSSLIELVRWMQEKLSSGL